MRLFIGTTVSSEIATAVEARIASTLAAGPWERAPLEQWHITSLFIGEREEASLPIIREAARHLASITPPIKLVEGKLVTMPKDAPSMLWIRFQPSSLLTALHVELAARTGTEPSVYRPYWPHITLARARNKRVPDVEPEVLIGEMVLTEITLFRSLPGGGGPVHTPMETWPLTGTDPTGHVVEA